MIDHNVGVALERTYEISGWTRTFSPRTRRIPLPPHGGLTTGGTVTDRLGLLSYEQLGCGLSACNEQGVRHLSSRLSPVVKQRIPSGIRSMIGMGIERESYFGRTHVRREGTANGKGPYRWFSRFRGGPNPTGVPSSCSGVCRLVVQQENRDFN